MSNIDVRECFEAGRPAPPPMIKDADWNADLAYERLKVVRDVKDQLSEGINNHTLQIPGAVAAVYEEIWERLKAVEKMEVLTIQYGS